MNKVAKSIALCTALAGILTGCAVPGGFGRGVEPTEGRFVQKMMAENCEVYSNNVKRIVNPDNVTVMSIRDGSFEGERIAHIGMRGLNSQLKYIKHAALLSCGGEDYWAAQALVDLGGDPYRRIIHTPSQKKKSYKISITWDDFDQDLSGTLQMRGNFSATLAVQLPNGQGTCLGSMSFPPKKSYGITWSLSCQTISKGGSGPTHSQTIETGVVGESKPQNLHQMRLVVGEVL